MNEVWGDGYGNRIDRFLACVAYLDGAHPSVIMCRGYYTRTVLVAWDWRNGQLTQRWIFDSDVVDPSKQMWRGQGNHSIAVADIDEDGRDEIIYGSLVVDDDGTALYSTGLGHGDAQHTTDLDPSRPGLETWSIHEKPAADRPGVELRNSRTGEIYFEAAHGIDVARGMAADIDPRHPGCEVWGGSNNLFSASGEDLGPRPRSQNMAIWWDGDLLREMLDGVSIVKWDYENSRDVSLFNGREEGVAANNGTKSNPCLSVDILGDWREELIARSADNSEIRIYVSTISTEYRLYTLLHDPIYRLSIAWQNVGYNQPPHPGFFLGDGMAAAPRPNIRLTRTGERLD
jgi:rhamnogalacturonan endolyase